MQSIGKNRVNKVLITYFVVYYAIFSIIFSTFLSIIASNDVIICVNFIVELFVFLIIMKLTSVKLKEDFRKLDYRKIGKFLFKIYIYFIIMNVVNVAVNLIIMLFSSVETSNNQIGIELMFGQYPIYIFFTAVIFAPIIEELVFRGTIYAHMRQKYGFFMCALLNSFIFAGLHFTVSMLMGDMSDIIFIFAYMAQSFVICYVYEKTQNIFMPITLHFINNAMGIAIMSLM